ncbi:MAG: putative N-acetylmannosamine-6-phosphate 2-epimerase [Stappiaceae bacterium]
MPVGGFKGQLIASCQPVIGGPMDKPEIVTALALACLDGGAAALRIEGIANVKAVRAATNAPIIGLVKRDLDDSPVRITPWLQDVKDLAQAGATIIAFDATERTRPIPVSELVRATHGEGALVMADCSAFAEGAQAAELGADLIGTTLAGYTGGAEPSKPNIDLVSDLARISPFVIAEGCYRTPEQSAQAISAGAYAVVVGSAITRTEHVTDWFATAVKDAATQRGEE